MTVVRYVHAADLHLDAAFGGAAPGGKVFDDATFTALERLVRLCEKEKPDFVVLAGDIYNQEDHSLRAQFALRDACRRLGEAGMQVFIAHGNHDPLTSRLAAIEWPENVVFFGSDVEMRPVEQNGRPVALVHGISHGEPGEARNLARLFRRDRGSACFQLGVLHCSVDGSGGDGYAPCAREDLISSGLDAWALGHVHKRQILQETPFIAYSGNIQGLHINETGAKGCYLVTATQEEGGWNFEADFHCLAPVLWERAEIDLDGVKILDEVESLLEGALIALRDSAPPECLALVVRVALRGATDLDGSLRDPETTALLAERLHYLAGQIPAVWIKDFEIETRTLINPQNYLDRDDLVGEVARICNALARDRAQLEKFARERLEQLYDNPRLRPLVGMPDGDTLQELLFRAQRLCLEMLEKP